jgi:hypothetical protein
VFAVQHGAERRAGGRSRRQMRMFGYKYGYEYRAVSVSDEVPNSIAVASFPYPITSISDWYLPENPISSWLARPRVLCSPAAVSPKETDQKREPRSHHPAIRHETPPPKTPFPRPRLSLWC